MKDKRWQHSASTSKGRVERAVAILREGEQRGLMVASTMHYLRSKVSETELIEALNIASGGELVRTALS